LYGGEGEDTFSISDGFSKVYGENGDDTFKLEQDQYRYTFETLYDGGDGYDVLEISGYTSYLEEEDEESGASFEDSSLGHSAILNIRNFEKIKILDDGTSLETGWEGNSAFTDDLIADGITFEIEIVDNNNVRIDASAELGSSIIFRGGGSLIQGGAQDDQFFGNSSSNNFKGNSGDDIAYGYDSNDEFEGGAGNDYLDGGDGIDTAIFSGNQSDYTIEISVDGLYQSIVVDGIDGRDELTKIETLRFDDGEVDVRPAGRTIRDTGQAKFLPISGNPILGETLIAGDLVNDPDGTFSTPNIVYQWQRSSLEATSWSDIANATDRSYQLTSSDLDQVLRVKATYTDGLNIRSTIASDPIYTYSISLPNVSFDVVAGDNEYV
jgi:Ca2+-binding RTX toxin-like protein